MSNVGTGGTIRILWDADDAAEVTITGNNIAAFTVNGSAVTFPYTLNSSTTFSTIHNGTYTVSVKHHGIEVANTPDGTKTVVLENDTSLVFAPSPDNTSTAKFTSDLFASLDAAYVGQPDTPGQSQLLTPDGLPIPSGSYAWTPYSGNPIMAAAAGSISDGNAFMDLWHDDTAGVFHAYTSVDGTNGGIYHYTSTDGLTNWQADANNPVIPRGAAGSWDAYYVGVPTVWQENGTVYVLYRGMADSSHAQIGLATAPASDPGNFTKYGSNPIITGAGSNSFVGTVIEPGPGRCIKVGSTYYLFISSVLNQNQRAVAVMSATSPEGPWSWAATTGNANDPVWTDGSLCNSVWTDGTYFYALLCHHRSWGAGMIFQLWRSTDVTFPYWNRDFLGVVRDLQGTGWESTALDTPTVFCDTIQRNTFKATGNMPRIYYSGSNSSGLFLPGVLMPSLVSHPVPFDRKPVSPVGQWQQVNVTPGVSGQQIPLNGSALNFYTFPQSGSVVSIAAHSSVPLTAGRITIYVTDSSGNLIFQGVTGTDFSCTLRVPQNPQTVQASRQEGLWHFGAGDAVGVKITATSDLAPANINLGVTLGVLFNYGS